MLLQTDRKERTRRFSAEQTFKAMYANTHIAADRASEMSEVNAGNLTREQTAEMVKLLSAAFAAAVALDNWKKNQ